MTLNPRRILVIMLVAALAGSAGAYFYWRMGKQLLQGTVQPPRPEAAAPADSPAGVDKAAEPDPSKPVVATTPLQRRLTYLNPEYPRAFAVYDQTPTPQGPVAPYIAALWDKADGGDAYAGYLVFRAVYRCVQVQRKRSVSDSSENLGQLETDVADCKDVSQADIERAYRALHRSAEQGDVEAIMLFELAGPGNLETDQELLRNPEAVVRYRADNKRFLEKAVAMGSLNAIVALAGTYGAGVMVEADPVTAYAYQYVAVQVRPDKSPAALATLEPYAARLNAQQIQEGQAKALEILDRCCR